MTPEQQRIKIAEACGEINPRTTEFGGCVATAFVTKEGVHVGFHGVPDYLNDLNAMHEAKQTLWKKDWDHRHVFNDHLANIIKGRIVNRNEWDAETLLDATAEQQAEAFLRTLNLWEE
jgi:hypothetical protein